jgi:hypothetical protein
MNRRGLNILHALLVGLFAFSHHAFAGAAMMSPSVAKVAGETAPPASCTNDYKTASGYFQQVLGEDATLDRIPAFVGKYSVAKLTVSAENRIFENGGTVFLESKLSMGGIPFGDPIHVPVKICKEGSRLTATLIMSSAVLKNKKGDRSTKGTMVNVEHDIVINISRNPGDRKIVFKSETYPDQPASAVSLK